VELYIAKKQILFIANQQSCKVQKIVCESQLRSRMVFLRKDFIT